MHDKPFTKQIAELEPELWERFVRAVERERREGDLRREYELYGRPVRFYSIEEVKKEIKAA